MSVKLTRKDWILISAYLDKRLSPAEKIRVSDKLANEPDFLRASHQIAYTRRLLAELPVRHAPRNFTLSRERSKTLSRRTWFQPAMSFVSIAAAVMFVIVLAGPMLFSSARSAAPMVGMAPEMAFDNSAQSSQKSTEPMIIQWFPEGSAPSGAPESYNYYGATGKGGGGAGGPGFGVGGGETAVETPMLTMVLPTPTMIPPSESVPVDPNTLILGLPESSTSGEDLTRELRTAAPVYQPLSTRAVLMIASGALALLAGAAALFLRRR